MWYEKQSLSWKECLGGIQSALLSELALKQVVKALSAPINNVACCSLAQRLRRRRDVSVGENFRNEAFQRAEEERDCFVEKVYWCSMEKDKFEKMRLQKEVPIRAIESFLLVSESITSCLETMKISIMKADKSLFYCSLQKSMRSSENTNRIVESIWHPYVRSTLNIESKLWSIATETFLSGSVTFWAEDRLDGEKWKAEESKLHGDEWKMYAHSVLFSIKNRFSVYVLSRQCWSMPPEYSTVRSQQTEVQESIFGVLVCTAGGVKV